LNVPELKPDEWHVANARYVKRLSSMSTYKCWKCSRIGHLPEDCTASIGVPAASLSDPFHYTTLENPNKDDKHGGIYTPVLRKMYSRCKLVAKKAAGAKCSICAAKSNLAFCFDCDADVCDDKGHLLDHLRDNPSHTRLYSYKLQRQIKCSKSTCEEMDIYNLFQCPSCLSKCFDRHYSIVNATWSGKGLHQIPNALACEEHFQWHYMNCDNTSQDLSALHLLDRDKFEDAQLTSLEYPSGQVSEFFF